MSEFYTGFCPPAFMINKFCIFTTSIPQPVLKSFSFLALLLLLTFSSWSQEKGSTTTFNKLVNTPTGIDRNELIAYAKQYLGIPYHLGCADPKRGFDCSGFVSFVFRHFNLSVPRSSREYKALGKALKPEEFKVGDVLIYYGFRDRAHIGHVGIICEANGMKSRFIHASSGRAHSITISDLGSKGYCCRFYKCIDVIR